MSSISISTVSTPAKDMTTVINDDNSKTFELSTRLAAPSRSISSSNNALLDQLDPEEDEENEDEDDSGPSEDEGIQLNLEFENDSTYTLESFADEPLIEHGRGYNLIYPHLNYYVSAEIQKDIGSLSVLRTGVH
jgi:hypothetical protein